MHMEIPPYQPIATGLKLNQEQQQLLLLLKRGVWLYFLLLVFEGALRKWFFPALAAPLLIVRDPVALTLLAIAYHKGLFPKNIFVIGFISTGFISFFLTLLIGHGNLFVAIYGLRILVIHVPFMFLVGKIFRQYDVVKIGKAMLWIAIPMTVLIAIQFYSPQSAWVNRGVGGDMEGAGFSGAMGYFRPPGTFSFTNGTTLFYGMLTPFVTYFWLQQRKTVSFWILSTASVALIAAIPLSISRGLFFQVSVSVFFTLFAVLKQPRLFSTIAAGAFALILMALALKNFSFFQTATEAFALRFQTANETEGGLEGVIVDRYLGGMYEAIFGETEIPFWGLGLGMGTNVGSMLLSGQVTFLISEGEWGRIIGEMGFLIGIALIYLRIITVLRLGIKSYQSLTADNPLPWLILSFSLLNVMQGQWAQPTSLGFAIMSGGLTIAALKCKTSDKPNCSNVKKSI